MSTPISTSFTLGNNHSPLALQCGRLNTSAQAFQHLNPLFLGLSGPKTSLPNILLAQFVSLKRLSFGMVHCLLLSLPPCFVAARIFLHY